MKNVYGYVRVSTTRQGLGVSLEVQQQTIERFAAQNNFRIVQWFVEKVTAAKVGRPLFTQLVKQLRDKRAEGVIMHKIDRSARNLKDWSALTDIIEGDPNMEVHFAHESFDLRSRGGRLAGDIQAAVAADFIRNNRQETIKGLDGRLKQGLWPFKAPVGYVDNGKGKHKTAHRVEGPLVQKAFELYATNKYTLETLAEKMNALGLRNVNKGVIRLTAISRILNNPFYVGILKSRRGSFKGGHKALVSPELFQRVQDVLRGNTNQKVVRHDYQFRKQLTCEGCGYSLTAELQKSMVYYRCHTKGCVTKGIRETAVRSSVEDAFAQVTLMPEESEMLEEILSELESDWSSSQQELLNAVTLQLNGVQDRLERLTDCYVEGGLDREAFEKRKEALLFETKQKEASLNELRKDKEHIFRKARKFFELAKSLIESYEKGSFDKKRKIVETTTSNLSVQGKNLIVSMRSPFLEMAERDKFSFGDHDRTGLRKVSTESAEGNKKPLSREQIRQLVKIVMDVIAELPEDSPLNEYDV